MDIVTSWRGGRGVRGELMVWIACLGVVPLLALGGAFVVANARHGRPASTASDLAVGFLTYWATPVCGVLVGRACGLGWRKLVAIAILGVGAVLAWFYVVFVLLVALHVWVQPSPD